MGEGIERWHAHEAASQGLGQALGVAMPMRSPVKDPGPVPTAMRSMAVRGVPDLFSTSSMTDRSIPACPALTVRLISQAVRPSLRRATDRQLVEVSGARTCTLLTL